VFYISTKGKGKGKASGNAFTFHHHTSLLYANYPLKVTTTGSAILYTIFLSTDQSLIVWPVLLNGFFRFNAVTKATSMT